ncbi:hypothetical protein ACF073_36235 [Streptomyces sp. NPDC015171]|uniref:hypothetical protein n=1 Tax=Streptomyces sp. NPDC015171 TaxID=3364945 RepID=UPI0036FB3091
MDILLVAGALNRAALCLYGSEHPAYNLPCPAVPGRAGRPRTEARPLGAEARRPAADPAPGLDPRIAAKATAHATDGREDPLVSLADEGSYRPRCPVSVRRSRGGSVRLLVASGGVPR